jgi:hypothetical protein
MKRNVILITEILRKRMKNPKEGGIYKVQEKMKPAVNILDYQKNKSKIFSSEPHCENSRIKSFLIILNLTTVHSLI